MPSPSRTDGDHTRQRRREWYGDDEDKHVFWQFCDEVVYATADVAIPALPALVYLMNQPPRVLARIAAPVFFTLGAMILGASAFRGGWLPPPGASEWVSLTVPSLLLRVPYYGGTLLVAAYGGAAIELAIGSRNAATAFALVAAIVAIGVFPRFVTTVRSATE